MFVTQKKNITRCYQGDRFIPNRSTLNQQVAQYLLSSTTPQSEDSSLESYQALLASSLFSESSLSSCRVLSSLLNKCRPKDTTPELPQEPKKTYTRDIPAAAEKVLDAPGLIDDYYLNLLDWSSSNIISIGLGGVLYLWNASTAEITELVSYTDKHITSVNFSPCNPQYLAIGNNLGTVEIWDIEKSIQIRQFQCPGGRVSSLAWNKSILSCGNFDGSIVNHDLRVTNDRTDVSVFMGHSGEVCGLKWSPDGTQLASGGNDNLLNIWQFDVEGPKFTFNQHKAAVKAVAWCPWQPHLLASGGGSADRCIKLWNTQSGACLNSVDTESQVCSIIWAKNRKELVSSHGFSKNQICVWKYPSMTKLAELTGHTQRVMHMSMSPDGTTVCSASADETLRFWRIFDAPPLSKSITTQQHRTDRSIRCIR